jgi:archaellum component FlaF (FlaF/FlaG flagellin family)
MKNLKRVLAALIAGSLIAFTTIFGIAPAQAAIDVSYLQTCLKEEGSSLDVLVLMDSSGSLRDATDDEIKSGKRKTEKGSDPDRKRGIILKSSLKILRSLAEESGRTFNINLRNFGKNSDPKELEKLKERWVEWTSDTSDGALKTFVEKAVYDDSPGTQWANGLISAQDQFKKRIGEAKLAGTSSCSIMFWITDGAPTDSTEPICAPSGEASLNWFRENNILVLGGLLKPKEPVEAKKAEQFGPLVRGENCGENQPGWTRGEVIVAEEIDDLAWEFVELIAGIKNLINLNGNGSTFSVDPSTSHIEIYTRGTGSNWEIRKPDGSVFCSKSKPSPKCVVTEDSEVGITTIEVYPDKPIDAAGTWSISPSVDSEDFRVYGGLSTNSGSASKTKPNLVISKVSGDLEEGKQISFLASILNPDGSAFSLQGYKSVTICAWVASSKSSDCESGKSAANLTVIPSTTDKSVSFEAVLVSERDDLRGYIIPATVKINVIPSGLFPSLVCDKEPCVLSTLANKNSKAISNLTVKAPTSASQGGTVILLGTTILSDGVEGRGDGHFTFVVQKENGEIVEFNNESQILNPGDKLTLTVTTDLGGKSEIQGVLKYKVSANGQEIVRQLDFKFNVGNDINRVVLIGLMLLAYLITIGLPYAFLLWSARRNAFLSVTNNAFAYLTQEVVISENGKVISKASMMEDSLIAVFPEPSDEDLIFSEVAAGARSIEIGNVKIEVIPPKWNPFDDPITTVEVVGNHVMSTADKAEFLEDRADFSRSVAGDSVIYFPTEQGLAPVTKGNDSSLEDSSNSAPFAAAPAQKTGTELMLKTGDILATTLLIVPRYGDREDSLRRANLKLKGKLESANLATHVAALRKNALEVGQAKVDELEKAKPAKEPKKPVEAKEKGTDSGFGFQSDSQPTTFSFLEERLDGTEKNPFSPESDDQGFKFGEK